MIKVKLNLNKIKLCSELYLNRKISTTNQTLLWYKRLWNWTPKSLNVTQIGDPVLRKKAEPVPLDKLQSKEIQFIINKMIDILRHNDCVGLAAPQIGISLQIIVMEFHEKLKKEFSPSIYKSRKMETLPLTILLNPTINFINNNKTNFYEGCASVKGYSAQVERFEEAILNGIDENGNNANIHLKGWNARIAQHEMDHLAGTVYIDKMDSLTFRCNNVVK